MRRFIAAVIVALLFATGVGTDTAGSTPETPEKVVHTYSQCKAVMDYIEAAAFGPEPNGVWFMKVRGTHYLSHYCEMCWYTGLGGQTYGHKYHALYDLITGELWWLPYDSWCSYYD